MKQVVIQLFFCSDLPAALPYIGAYLDIIYTLEMQHKTYNQNGLVNFAKMTELADMVTKVLQYQAMGFNFEPKPDVSFSIVDYTCFKIDSYKLMLYN